MLLRARLTNNNNDKTGSSLCKNSRCQVCKSMFNSDSFHSHNYLLIRSIRLIFRLTVIRLMLSICSIVLYVVFNMWIALVRLLG